MKLHETTSLCSTCKRAVAAEVVREGDRVVMRKRCEVHGEQESLVSSNAAWYAETMGFAAHLVPPGERKQVERGCPFDCGPCESHEQRNHLPVIPITSACNLDCPICYTHNKNEGAYHMEEAELAAILAHLRRSAPEKRIVNVTGGEPTMHPKWIRLLEMCREEGIRRVTLSTHGLGLHDDAVVAKLKELDVRVILSFDSFREETNRRMLGGAFGAGKMRALATLERHGVDTTLLPVMARGMNDDETGALVDLALSKDFIRSVEFHPMTFTGQYGASFDRDARYTAYDALLDLETRTGGLLRVADFVPSPAAHPLCYQVAYLLRVEGGRWVPFTRFMPRAAVREMLVDTLYLLPGRRVEEVLTRTIDELWAGGAGGADGEAVLRSLRGVLDEMGDPSLGEEERTHIAERSTKAIYVHTHMDEETFDTDRIRQCCVGMPGADGSNVPSCAYNVLYRERDARFLAEPRAPVSTLGRGRLPVLRG